MEWRKSSVSAGTACVELCWKTSSFTNGGGACVAVRSDLGAVRDSKSPVATLNVQVKALIDWVSRGK